MSDKVTSVGTSSQNFNMAIGGGGGAGDGHKSIYNSEDDSTCHRGKPT